jgi:hypothetical protein
MISQELQISEESTFEETFEWIWKSPFKDWLEGSNVTQRSRRVATRQAHFVRIRLVDKSVTISVNQSVRGFLTISQLKLENN